MKILIRKLNKMKYKHSIAQIFFLLFCRQELVHFTGGGAAERECIPEFHCPLSDHAAVQRGLRVPGDVVLPEGHGAPAGGHIQSSQELHSAASEK